MKSSPETARRVKRYQMLRQICEIAGVIILTSLLGLYWIPPEVGSRSIMSVGIVMMGLLLLGLAIGCAYKADAVNDAAMRKDQEDADSKTYLISKTRIEVLNDKGVPDSVRSFLNTLITQVHVGEQVCDLSGQKALLIKGADLSTALTDGLGSQIANQFKDTIFQYTLTADKKPSPDPRDTPQDSSTSAASSANSQVSQLRQDPVNA